MIAMKKRRKLLVDALRSGEFKQGRGLLKNGERYCCLGVACEVYRRVTGKGGWERGDMFGDGHIRSSAFLPPSVQKWFGFITSEGGFKSYMLTRKNDLGASFAEIADIIEKEPSKLFTKNS